MSSGSAVNNVNVWDIFHVISIYNNFKVVHTTDAGCFV